MRTSNSELVAAVIDGDIHRYSEVVRRFDQRVRRFASQQLGDASVAEDIVQETFYRAFKNLDRLKDHEQLENWLLVIARNCVHDHFRKLKQRRETTSEPANQIASIESEVDQMERDWIWHEVEQLQPAHAQILTLRYLQGYSYREIAEHLVVPESTIRGRIYEARKALRRRLVNRKLFP